MEPNRWNGSLTKLPERALYCFNHVKTHGEDVSHAPGTSPHKTWDLPCAGTGFPAPLMGNNQYLLYNIPYPSYCINPQWTMEAGLKLASSCGLSLLCLEYSEESKGNV